jgi:hypothetical protein
MDPRPKVPPPDPAAQPAETSEQARLEHEQLEHEQLDQELDQELDDTFPASDPLPWSHEVN